MSTGLKGYAKTVLPKQPEAVDGIPNKAAISVTVHQSMEDVVGRKMGTSGVEKGSEDGGGGALAGAGNDES